MSKPTQTETAPRKGFVLLTAGVTLLLVSGLWFIKMLWSQPTETAEAPAATEEVATNEESETYVRMTTQTRVPAVRHMAKKTKAAPKPPPPPPAKTTIENGWGIQVSSMRLSMGNSVVDLRYKVLDPEKAARLGDGKTPAYIIDRTTGKKLVMPTPPKEGAFPPYSSKLVAGRTYFSMVSNQGGTLKSGSQVTVVIGGSEATNLTVE
jgi:hypothetical protein